MKLLICTLLAAVLAVLAGCGGRGGRIPPVTDTQPPAQSGAPDATLDISPITALEDGFSSAQFAGDDGFEDFLATGGASSDGEVIRFLARRLAADLAPGSAPFGCSTLAVQSPEGHALFGRNFDWQSCDALVLTSKPTQGYASISTVNLILSGRAAAAWAGCWRRTRSGCWRRCTLLWTA